MIQVYKAVHEQGHISSFSSPRFIDEGINTVLIAQHQEEVGHLSQRLGCLHALRPILFVLEDLLSVLIDIFK